MRTKGKEKIRPHAADKGQKPHSDAPAHCAAPPHPTASQPPNPKRNQQRAKVIYKIKPIVRNRRNSGLRRRADHRGRRRRRSRGQNNSGGAFCRTRHLNLEGLGLCGRVALRFDFPQPRCGNLERRARNPIHRSDFYTLLHLLTARRGDQKTHHRAVRHRIAVVVNDYGGAHRQGLAYGSPKRFIGRDWGSLSRILGSRKIPFQLNNLLRIRRSGSNQIVPHPRHRNWQSAARRKFTE